MNLIIISAKYVDEDHTYIDFLLKDSSNNIEIPFTYKVNGTDTAPISIWLNTQWKSGLIHPDEYDGPSKGELLAAQIRSKRSCLLNSTDKYMTLDFPMSEEDRAAVRQYRQALRDIPSQEGFPNEVVWPEKPDILD